MEVKEQKSLTREQKEAVGILSIGTFLEFFDLMLYVHMAVLLNELFFPQTDPFTGSLLTAFAFCSSFVFRPFGALIFGWIGDNIGRKATVTITTIMMAVSCVIMANIPTYAQVGIMASWLVTICRIVQGLSSIGEIVGAELYLTEITKRPVQYPVVAFIEFIAVLGTTAALGIASLAISFGFNWRLAFWVGAIIAVVGAVARTSLRETPEFADAKRRLKNKFKENNIEEEILKDDVIYNIKINKKTTLAYFLIDCCWPFFSYFTYFYCGSILKNSFGYSASQIIYQNAIVSAFQMLSWFILACISYKIYPLKILKIKVFIFFPFIIFCPYLLNNINNSSDLFFIQLFVAMFAISSTPAIPIFFSHFTIFKRFTYASLIYALSRAFIYVFCSFGLVYLVEFLGYWGISVIMIPLSIGYIWGISHFYKLERESGNYSQKISCNIQLHSD